MLLFFHLFSTFSCQAIEKIGRIEKSEDFVKVDDETKRTMRGSNNKCMPRNHLKNHINRWVDEVPYSHIKNSTWGYPTDCSGFISWALKVKDDLKAYDYASTKYSSAIEIDDLQFGDIIVHIFDKSKYNNRCSKNDNIEEEEEAIPLNFNERIPLVDSLSSSPSLISASSPLFLPNPWEYLSGHVFFFDRWDDDTKKDQFWAYESSETQDQTKQCLAQNNEITRSQCLNHHVLKSRKVIEKYAKNSCHDPKYKGEILTGGAKRLVKGLLC